MLGRDRIGVIHLDRRGRIVEVNDRARAIFRQGDAMVAEALGLTLMEGQVAIRLAQGQTVREIAVATGRTAAAIHYHLHQIYQKQGITRQADLPPFPTPRGGFGRPGENQGWEARDANICVCA